MADSPLKMLNAELDALLIEGDRLAEKHREARQAERDAMRKFSNNSNEAQKLRVAIMAMEGKPIDAATYGKANVENNERQRMLRNGDAR